VKLVFVLAALFVVSVAAVVVGYYNTTFGFDIFPVKLILREVPVFRTAFFLTLLCPAVLLVSFWSARGDEGTYRNAVLGWSLLAPMPVAMLLLPGEQSKPEATSLHLYTLLFLVCASPVAAARSLASWFWQRGRSRDASQETPPK
jgi:hypothetical protein